MEFSLPIPQQLEKDGVVFQQWTCFTQRFQYHQRTSSGQDSALPGSVLLFAGQHQLTAMYESLSIYNMDHSKLNKILEIVEQACMPYLILLFERFRYFTLYQNTSEALEDFAKGLRKQADICEFGDLKDNIITEALTRGNENEKNLQSNASNLQGIPPDKSYSYKDKDNEENEDEEDEAGENSEVGDEPPSPVTVQSSVSHGIRSESKSPKTAVKRQSYKGKLRGKVAPISQKTKKVSTKKKFKPDKSVNKLFGNSKNFSCFLCKKAFVGERCFQKHFLTKHADCQQFECRHCDKIFSKLTEYTAHCKGHAVEEKQEMLKSGVSRKLDGLTESSKFRCEYCNKVYPREETLKRHVTISHADCMTFLCWNCEETLPDLRAYKQHSDKHILKNQFSCELCQKKNHSITRLIGHLKNHLVSRVKCETCGMVFAKPQYVAKHREKHHTNEPAYECHLCGKAFLTSVRLQYHMQRHTGEKRYTCELCGKSFSQKMSFDYHKLWHSGVKPYACDVCGKQYRSTGDLNRHKGKHTNKRAHVCELCGKGFRYSSSLVEHRKGHSDVRSYQCDVCWKTFIYRSGLRNHIREARCPGPGMGGGNATDRKHGPRATTRVRGPNPTVSPPSLPPPVHPLPPPPNPRQDLPVALQPPPESYTNPLSWHCMVRNSETEGGSSVVLIPPYY